MLRRRAGEQSEGGRRGLGPRREMIEDFLDHHGIFDARSHLDRATTVLAGALDVGLNELGSEQLHAKPTLLQFAPPIVCRCTGLHAYLSAGHKSIAKRFKPLTTLELNPP